MERTRHIAYWKKRSDKNVQLFCEQQWMKTVQIWSFFWSVFFCIQSEYRETWARKNSVFGDFSRSERNNWVSPLCKAKKSRSSHLRCSVGKGVLRNFAKFIGEHLCQSLLFNKVAGLSQNKDFNRMNDWTFQLKIIFNPDLTNQAQNLSFFGKIPV